MDFRVFASTSVDALDSLYLLMMDLNSLVSNDVACFTFDALM